ncbi:MAG: molybdopterin-dependent oxidoreductase [Gaiellaceae bacterium]
MDRPLVTVTVDGRTVRVPKGTGLVETAAEAGIEIPVFCYEPRLGPPVGACRMCLCEVGTSPKPMAACTMVAEEGLVVRTALTSAKAADAQNATLEFLLVNHPLDCPVCDKGGECPLQDLTFRYGPGRTRMTFEKRTFEKPIPISPTIALDRERCILCYRCTRFSEGVAEDAQLVAVNRGAQTMIATFDDLPYTDPFSGNVTELCPVGALTSTQYRFLARPWEIQSTPSVCGLCPVGCNVDVTAREGKVRRIQSRNHPEVDQGWLCDKGRFAYPHLYADDRIVDPLVRVGRRTLEDASWEAALDEAERLLRGAQGRIVTALSGSETVEQAYGLARLLRAGLGAHAAVLPEQTSGALDSFRLPLSAIAEAQLVVVVGDDPVVERAPVVELWLKAAARAGAEVVRIGPQGDVQAPPGRALDTCRRLTDPASELGGRLRGADRAVLIWSGPGGDGGAHVAALAAALGLAGKPGSGAFLIPSTPNARGVADAWACASDEEDEPVDSIGLLLVSGDEAAADPNVRALAAHAEAVIAVTMFRRLAGGGWLDLVLPGTSYLERDGTYINLEGRPQRLRRAVIPPAPDELAWISKLAERFDIELSPHPRVVFDEISPRVFGDLAFADLGRRAPLPPRLAAGEGEPAERPPAEPQRTSGGGPLQLVRYRPLFSGPEVERVPELQFQRPPAELGLSVADAQMRGISTGDAVRVSSNGTSVELRARIDRTLVTGAARVAEEHAAELGSGVEVSRRQTPS